MRMSAQANIYLGECLLVLLCIKQRHGFINIVLCGQLCLFILLCRFVPHSKLHEVSGYNFIGAACKLKESSISLYCFFQLTELFFKHGADKPALVKATMQSQA